MLARSLVVGIAALAYIVATHWLMTSAPASDWNAVVVVGPMLALAGLYAVQLGKRWLAALCALALVGLVAEAWHGGGFTPASLYVAQHVSIHLLLAFAFGRTLQAGREPLITALARRVHGGLTPPMVDYSRKVTIAWTLYFIAIAALSLVLYAAAPFDVWAAFANLGTPVTMAIMFVGEYVLRYRLHPEFERATLADAVRAFSRHTAPPAAGPSRRG